MVQQIAQAKLAPDADVAFLGNLEQILIDYIKGSPSTPNQPPAAQVPGQQSPMPVEMMQPPRGLSVQPDQGPMVADLEAQMAGMAMPPGAA